eukprot:753505-Hanusia_phi.AAC.1
MTGGEEEREQGGSREGAKEQKGSEGGRKRGRGGAEKGKPLGVEVSRRDRDQVRIAPPSQAAPRHLSNGCRVDGGRGGDDLNAELHLPQHLQHHLLPALGQRLLPRAADEKQEGLEAHDLVPDEGGQGQEECVLRVAVCRHHRPALPVGRRRHEGPHGVELEAEAEEQERVDALIDLQHLHPSQLEQLRHLRCCVAQGTAGLRRHRDLDPLLLLLLRPLVLVQQDALHRKPLPPLPLHYPSSSSRSKGDLPRVRVHEEVYQPEGGGSGRILTARASMQLNRVPSNAQVHHSRPRRLLRHLQLSRSLPVDEEICCRPLCLPPPPPHFKLQLYIALRTIAHDMLALLRVDQLDLQLAAPGLSHSFNPPLPHLLQPLCLLLQQQLLPLILSCTPARLPRPLVLKPAARGRSRRGGTCWTFRAVLLRRVPGCFSCSPCVACLLLASPASRRQAHALSTPALTSRSPHSSAPPPDPPPDPPPASSLGSCPLVLVLAHVLSCPPLLAASTHPPPSQTPRAHAPRRLTGGTRK